MGKYSTIVMDPPWEYAEGFKRSIPTGKSLNVKRDGAKALVGGFQMRERPYADMSLAEIQALPIGDLAADDCRLFLWTTNRWLIGALRLLPGWGFTYRQLLVWHKADGGPFVTSVAPNTAEFVVVAAKGEPERTGSFPSSVFRFPAVREHSTKPDAFLDIVEQVSPGPYLEMFARRARFGWEYWGDESLKTAEMA